VSKLFQHAWRNLVRDWRSGQLKLLTLALIIAVASVTSISFFADRLKQVFENQATELLAADIVILSSEAINKKLILKANKLKLKTSLLANFPSVVVNQNGTKAQSQLVNIKAISRHYPLRGSLKISETAFHEGTKTDRLPNAGEAWIESRLIHSLKIKIGDVLQVGYTQLTVTKILTYEPDRGSEFFNIAPRLLMRYHDLKKTKLITTGSRVKYRLLLAGTVTQLKQYRQWATTHLSPLESLQSLRDARPELRNAIERGERYLSLAGLVSVLLAGVAIAIACRRFVQLHLDHCAIFKCLGASQNFINGLFFLQFTFLGLITCSIGLGIAWVTQEFLAWIAESFIRQQLPAPSLKPIMSGFILGMGTLYLFSLSQINRLKNTSPLRVIRKDLSPATPGFKSIYTSLILLLTFFLFYQLGDWLIAIRVLFSSILTVAILGLFAYLLLKIIVKLSSNSKLAWRYGVTNIIRRSQTSSIQIVGFGIALMALLLLSIVRTDLLDQWQTTIPIDSPNQFVINIQDQQRQQFQDFFSKAGFDQLKFYPMIRGRLIKINQKTIKPNNFENPRAKRLAAREFNLSWSKHLQSKNKILNGQWWDTNDKSTQQFSIESGIAKALGIKLNDTLSFLISGKVVSAQISSIRKVNWDTMRPNFFIVAKPGLLEPHPRTWISSFYLKSNNKDYLTKLVQAFPNVTIIDVDVILKQIRNIIDKAVLGIEFIFIFTLIAGFTVLLAAIQSSQEERLREGALIRALGGSRRLLLKSYFIEFAIIGFIAGLIAAIGASVAAYFISQSLLNIEYNLKLSWWLIGMLGGSLGIGSLGLLGTFKLLKKPPMESLRNL